MSNDVNDNESQKLGDNCPYRFHPGLLYCTPQKSEFCSHCVVGQQKLIESGTKCRERGFGDGSIC